MRSGHRPSRPRPGTYAHALAALLCLVPASIATGGEPDLDLLVLRSGESHQGMLQPVVLTLTTPYGSLALPIDRLRGLRAGLPGAGADRLVTIEGERFTGALGPGELWLRSGTTDPRGFAIAEVSRIERTERRPPATASGTPDLVETREGDLFRARVLADRIRLRTEATAQELSTSGIHLLDVQPEGELLYARVRFDIHGYLLQGVLVDTAFDVETRGGDRLRLPASSLAAIAFGVLPSQENLPARLDLMSCRHGPCLVFRDRLRDGSLGPEIVALRAASFIRGDLHGEGRTDEKPPAPVTLGRPFAIGRYELTFEEYDQFATASGRPRPDDSDWGRGRRPVINVSWEDAVAYTQWLSEQTGQRYRLPTDAEWEYAARGGTGTRYWWGDTLGVGKANCAGCGSLWDSRSTAPVGRFPPNPFGLYDTAGNVFEWVADCYTETFATAPADAGPYENPAGCGQRVYRGGSWSFPPREIRSSNRWRDFATGSSDDMGFRVVRELGP